MEAVIFSVVTKAVLLLVAIIGFIVWQKAGCPFYTITFRK